MDRIPREMHHLNLLTILPNQNGRNQISHNVDKPLMLSEISSANAQHFGLVEEFFFILFADGDMKSLLTEVTGSSTCTNVKQKIIILLGSQFYKDITLPNPKRQVGTALIF